MKKQILLLIVSAALFAGCTGSIAPKTADQEANSKQEQLSKEGNAEVGLPDIHNFTEKKMMKMLYELRDNPNLINYAYLWSEVSGKWVFFGKCVGYGIPYSTQFTASERPAHGDETFEAGNITVPQAEPNGLFMPPSSSGTWLMMVDPNNPSNIKPVYVEPNVIVSPFKLPNQ